jgi:protein-tyrosine phosphatase
MWLKGMPELADLARKQPGDPELPRVFHAGTDADPVYPMVHVPVYGRSGTLWVGRVPGGGNLGVVREVDALVSFGIGRVVSLVPARDVTAYVEAARERFGERFRVVPVADFGTPPDDRLFEHELALTDEALGAGSMVLVHCLAGCGRTGMFVSCLLVRAGDAPQSAIRRYRRLRGCGPETPEQVAYVVRYARRLGEGMCG